MLPRTVLCIAALLLAAAGPVPAAGAAPASAASPEYRADVARLFSELLSAEQLEAQRKLIVPAITAGLRKGLAGVDERSLAVYSSELGAAVDRVLKEPARLAAVMTPLLQRNFSHDELKEVLAFHATPTGRKWRKLVFEERLVERAFVSWARANVPAICRRASARLQKENLPPLPDGACRK